MFQKERRPEHEEVFNPEAARQYADGCDFEEGKKRTSDYEIVATEAARAFGNRGRLHGLVVEVCPGPGNLCGELVKKGADRVIGVDASETMIAHASRKFLDDVQSGKMQFRLGWAQQLPVQTGVAEGSANFNSFHQFADGNRALDALREMIRVLKPGGWGFVRDFRRNVTPVTMDRFLRERKVKTPEVAELLRESLGAAFTEDEFVDMLKQIDGISFSVGHARDPRRIPSLWPAIWNDPVPHWLDHRISQNVKIRKDK